jgi:hypothetical protein
MEALTQNEQLLQVEIPVKCTKKDIKNLALNIIDNAIEENRVLKTAEGLAVMEKLVKAVREEITFVNAVVDALEQNNRILTTANGTIIETVEAGVKYDYSYDAEWNELDQEVKKWTEAKKAREAILKSAKSGIEKVDESTGELIVGANKKSKSTYRITLAK